MGDAPWDGKLWWKGIPGLDWRYPPPDPAWANWLCALLCAQRCTGPMTPVTGQYSGQNKLAAMAGHFRKWLDKALDPAPDGQPGDEDDGSEHQAERAAAVAMAAYSRRLALALACTAPGTDPGHTRVLGTAGLYLAVLGSQTSPPPRRRTPPPAAH